MDLTCGYLFRPRTPDVGIKDAPFTSSAAESRLKGYLKEMNADDGETLHGFRAGCAITLALTGADLTEIMDHVGWTRRHTILHAVGESLKSGRSPCAAGLEHWHRTVLFMAKY